ncbi:MAG: CinA family nicotinamide mononucleotide deamidase-related protein [Chitinophagaceae bacterium]
MKEVNASIVTIGDELLVGQTIDTNSAVIAQELNKIGIWVKTRIAIGDVKKDILNGLKEQSKNAQVIVITGGLGPTADDITKPALCEYFNSALIVDEAAQQNVIDIFTKLNRPLTERNLKQAEVPDNCKPLLNLRGTAPGMWFEKEEVVYISLPGVPHEMAGLLESSVIPELQKHFTLPAIVHKTAVTIGVGESVIADLLIDFENSLPAHIKLAYLPSYGLVKLRLTGKGKDKNELENELNKLHHQLCVLVKEWLMADEDISVQDVLGKLLDKHKRFIASAESCTGGYIAHLLTSRSGSSSSFKGSIVSYANEAKENALNVQHATLVKYGAVSEQTITEMVEGAITLLNVDYVVATSGIMGPDGGTKEKPVGTVWIAVGNRETVRTTKHFVRFDRKRNIEITAQIALNMLRKFIIEMEEK